MKTHFLQNKPIQNKLNKWVLVKFATKSTIKHYVGQIKDVVKHYPVVKFARRIKKCSVFVWPQENDEGEVQRGEIVVFLPSPVVSRRGQLSFPVSLTGLKFAKLSKIQNFDVVFLK